MTINLPEDVERFIRAEVYSGHFASEEEVITQAVELLRQRLSQGAKPMPAGGRTPFVSTPDPVLGSMREAAEELDQIIADAMRQREQRPWRLAP